MSSRQRRRTALVGTAIATLTGPVAVMLLLNKLDAKEPYSFTSAPAPVNIVVQQMVFREAPTAFDRRHWEGRMPAPGTLYFERLFMAPAKSSFQFDTSTGDALIAGKIHKEAFLIKDIYTLEADSLDPRTREVVGIFGSSPRTSCRWIVTVNGWQTGGFTTYADRPATVRIKLGRLRFDRTLSITSFPDRSSGNGVPCLMAKPQQFTTEGHEYSPTPR